MLSYGGLNGRDPGVELVIADSGTTLKELIPNIEARTRSGYGVWDASQARSKYLVPTTKLAPGPSTPQLNGDEGGAADAPCLAVQLTSFACGGTAVAVQAAHSVADALALSVFVAVFAANTNALNGSTGKSYSPSHAPEKAPVFDPSLLDNCAAGDMGSPQPDAMPIKEARTLPCHRYDWWDPLSAAGCPGSTSASVIPVGAQDDPAVYKREGGEAMPWDDWDVNAPVTHYLVHFSKEEIMRMWEAASADGNVSKHDALTAHIWSCINRARGLGDDADEVHLDMSIGLRNRVSPQLPEKFMGSPIMLAALSVSGREASQNNPAGVAKKIRSTLSQFNDRKIAAHLG